MYKQYDTYVINGKCKNSKNLNRKQVKDGNNIFDVIDVNIKNPNNDLQIDIFFDSKSKRNPIRK